ncbi:hypothetical protein CLOP_g10668 [Closterium sp. NIES-67]|nr:hypothetical protein CLOP_g10668 [Closterium sp. NIES-67]
MAQLYVVRWIASTAADTPTDIDKLCAAVPDDLATVIRKHTDIFPDNLLAGLPPQRPHDHKIELDLGAQPTVRTQWRLTQPELDELRRQLDYLLKKSFVRPSTSPFADEERWRSTYVCRLPRLESDYHQVLLPHSTCRRPHRPASQGQIFSED